MGKYRKGDVVNIWDTWENPDGSLDAKPRPAIIYEVDYDDHYTVLLYGTDRTGKFPGFVIESQSEDGKCMNLTKDTFVHLESMYIFEEYVIIQYRGKCTQSIIEKIEKIIKEGNTLGLPPSFDEE